MNKAPAFILGLLTGALFVTIILYTTRTPSEFQQTQDESISGLTLFSKPGDCIPIDKEINVIQVIGTKYALAETGDFPNRIALLLTNKDGQTYYDNQLITAKKQDCARQIGIFKYRSKLELDKTVPVVILESKTDKK